jgi:hypothetical protein
MSIDAWPAILLIVDSGMVARGFPRPSRIVTEELFRLCGSKGGVPPGT